MLTAGDGPIVDSEGRILDPHKIWEAKQNHLPEEVDIFVKDWSPQQMSPKLDQIQSSKVVWPNENYVVNPVRLDVYTCESPLLQQATTSQKRSLEIRKMNGWEPTCSLFFMDRKGDFTKEICIEAAAPPRRNRFRPSTQSNHRDLSDWTPRETVHAFVTATNVPGAKEFSIDWADSPDRYVISPDLQPAMGWRRTFRFAAYPVTQYYILEKIAYHNVLEAEGGKGLTSNIERGPVVFAKKGWSLKGSFYAFDLPITGTNKYTVYTMEEPFPRMMIAIGAISHVEAWKEKFHFYAFDVPVPATCVYQLQHCVRSIHSTAASVSRHRLSVEDPRNPFEFRMNIYVFPAPLENCSITQTPINIEEEPWTEK